MDRIAIGQTASVTFAALPGRRFEAQVREVAPAADPQSRTYRVKLTLTQPAAAVRFGMTGEAVLSASPDGDLATAEPTFNIPATAIFHRGSDPAVWVIRGNSTLELRPVTVRSYGERSAVVTRGLRDGDSIVLAGVHTVFAGERVKPVKPLFTGEGENDDGRR
jgi:membrane fusion protein, multidrug efflux system